MTEPVLSTVVKDAIWATERPLWFSGVRLRTRSTIVRLDDGSLLLHSPPVLDDALAAAIDALGEVRVLVVPNCFHHLAAPAAAARYPAATLVGPRSAAAKNPQLTVSLDIEDPAVAALARGLDVIKLDGCPFLDETVFFHRATGSLIGADLVMSACARDHWSWRVAGRLTGVYGKVRPPPDVRLKTKRSEAAARTIDRLSALPLERILVAHADPIDDRPAERLAEAWQFARPTA